tara:strand:- start:2793 stop:5444 length:2652 start_codon:yes stop_codon:yes gene_type:complete
MKNINHLLTLNMYRYIICIILIYIPSAFLFADPYKQLDIKFLKKKKEKTVNKKIQKISNKQNSLPEYTDLVKDFAQINGLFDLYWDSKSNKSYISIKPEQLTEIYIMNITRQSGDAYYYGGPSMLDEFPFQFNKVGNNIQLVHINVLFRAEKDKAISRAVQNDFSNSIVSSSSILSMPEDSTGAILVDASKLFIRDIGYVSQHGNGRYNFDYKNSYFLDIKSFIYNTELEISSHYKSKKPTSSYTLPNSRSMEIKYHISISQLQDNNYKPRTVDDRIGYFSTIYQDYSNTLQETQYVRYINRWNLQKKDPHKTLSEPIQPIIFWIENTVPEEFRPAIKEGIEGWNLAFENIGFKNAIIAKQMPDDANWDPADVRYSTIRWFIQPGAGYAVGPSRANPYTGEIYDADVRISADFVKGFYEEFYEYVDPIINDDATSLWLDENHGEHHNCEYSSHLRNEMASGWHKLINSGFIDGNDEELKDYIHKGLVDLVLHEVGHTLGLRHNFKASSIYTIDQLSNEEFTQNYGISGSVMDYHPVCLFDKGKTMFQTKPGVYDLWAIEYGYTEFFDLTDESRNLNNIAQKSNHPLLVYATDEDTFGRSSRGIDPLSNVWDISSDPIKYYKNELEGVQSLWENLLNKFEKDGQRYQKIRSVFQQGIGEYINAGLSAPRFLGGIYYHRNHIGDEGQKSPFIIVEPEKQREALEFLNEYFFDKDSFHFDPELLNKLAPERHEDFKDYVWRLDRVDYPIHTIVQKMQLYTLYSIFHPRRLSRIHDNEVKDDFIFTMQELFEGIEKTIWQELHDNENINSYKRELQKMHINLYSLIIYSNFGFPSDSVSLARQSLKNILKDIYLNLSSEGLDTYTVSHLEYASEMIEIILSAEIQIN